MKTLLVLLALSTGALVHAQQPVLDFNAHCAANYQWRALTNQIGQSESKLAVLKQNYSSAMQLKKQTAKATRKKSGLSPEEAAAKRDIQAEEANLNALKLKKNGIEEDIRKMMPPNQRANPSLTTEETPAKKKRKSKK